MVLALDPRVTTFNHLMTAEISMRTTSFDKNRSYVALHPVSEQLSGNAQLRAYLATYAVAPPISDRDRCRSTPKSGGSAHKMIVI